MYTERDDTIKGQMALNDLYEAPERTFAVSRIFARAHKQMSLNEQKALVYALTQVDFTKPIDEQDNLIKLDKKLLAAAFGFKEGYDTNHLSADLYEAIKELPEHSYIEIADKDKGLYSNGFVVANVSRFRNHFRLELSKTYLALFMGLEKDYLTMWSCDIFRMTNRRSVQFYEFLREVTDSRESLNAAELGVKKLKELFDIPKEGKGSYMRPADKGGFNRQMFEARIIDPLCEDIARCSMLTLVLQPNGKYYTKLKQGSRVVGYRFEWTFKARPGIECGQTDPQVLKAPKAVKGRVSRRKNAFVEACTAKPDDKLLSDFGAESWAELERKLISN